MIERRSPEQWSPTAILARLNLLTNTYVPAIRIDAKDETKRILENGIIIFLHYPIIIYLQVQLKKIGELWNDTVNWKDPCARVDNWTCNWSIT